MDMLERVTYEGGSTPRTYKRDPKGSTTGGQFTKNPASTQAKPAPKKQAKPTAKPSAGVPERVKPPTSMKRGADNDPARVAAMQKLLKLLGLGDLDEDGVFGPATEAAVKAAQKRLGMKPTGRASNGLVNRLLDAYDLSPCIQRSVEDDDEYVTRAEFEEQIGDLGEDEVEAEPTAADTSGLVEAVRANDPDEPYGDVEYADPGYQEDGKKRYPLDSEEHCRAAWSYINMPKNAAKYTPKQLDLIKGRIRRALKRYGVDTEDTSRSAEDTTGTCCRSGVHLFAREWPLDDIVIRSGGDGRTVEAYAAIFDSPAEIKDQHGHYMETIDRAAFNEALAGGIQRIGCYYHHGMTLHGTPSDLGSVPIGSPLEVRPDGRGLFTVTRYNKSELADAVLEAIRNGDITGYSFKGAIKRSNPPRIPKARAGMALPNVVRTALGLNEYGPTPTPAYAGAGIVAMRSAEQAAMMLAALDDVARAELIRRLSGTTPQDQEPETATPESGPGAEDQPVEALRSAADITRRIRVEQILRGM